MKKIITYLLLPLMLSIILGACNDELKDELFVKYVSFRNNGFVDMPVEYVPGGMVGMNIPVLINGTSENKTSIEVNIEVDNDTLPLYNFERFRNRTDLYYNQLPTNSYTFKTKKTTIESGQNTALLYVDIDLSKLDLLKEYVLPIKIISVSEFLVAKPSYSKSLMHMVPRNRFSGNYSVVGSVYDRNLPETGDDRQKPTPVSRRRAIVVNDNTIFFYAGSIDEDALDRDTYRINARMDLNDSTVYLTAIDNRINLHERKVGKISIKKELDALNPIIEYTITTLSLEYDYDDISTPGTPLNKYFKGFMTLSRERNVLTGR